MIQALTMQMLPDQEPPDDENPRQPEWLEYSEAESRQIAEYVTRQREALLDERVNALEAAILASGDNSPRGRWLNVFCRECD